MNLMGGIRISSTQDKHPAQFRQAKVRAMSAMNDKWEYPGCMVVRPRSIGFRYLHSANRRRSFGQNREHAVVESLVLVAFHLIRKHYPHRLAVWPKCCYWVPDHRKHRGLGRTLSGLMVPSSGSSCTFLQTWKDHNVRTNKSSCQSHGMYCVGIDHLRLFSWSCNDCRLVPAFF